MVDDQQIIFENSEFWIESFNFDNFIGANAIEDHTRTLRKAGDFLGCSANIWISNATAAIMNEKFVTIRKTDGSIFEIGDSLTAIRITLGNDGSSGINVGCNILMFMRKHG